ncbi:hypothetical protein ACIHEI_35760 [Kitasatospora sp. NPDC051984]|uniref:hypothetical protein n=1 Tax=Kitasatospora sp. NPDC051984 TaxID=3364059 RepID=UPI0037CC9955
MSTVLARRQLRGRRAGLVVASLLAVATAFGVLAGQAAADGRAALGRGVMGAVLVRRQLRCRSAGLVVASLLAVATAVGVLAGQAAAGGRAAMGRGVMGAVLVRRQLRCRSAGLAIALLLAAATALAAPARRFALRHQYGDLALLRTVAATPQRVRQLLRRQAALTLALLGTTAARAFLAALQHPTMASPRAGIGATLPAPAAATALATTGGEAR